MDKNKELSPEKSFELINEIISEARSKFEENGFIYMFWGALIAFATIGQFILIRQGHAAISWYPYLLMPAGAVFTAFYYARKEKSRVNRISKALGILWWAIAFNLMILGFFYAPLLREHLIPVFLILQGIGMIGAGAIIENRWLLLAGLVTNIAAFICFHLDWQFHPLLAGIVAIVAIFVPGMMIMLKHKKSTHV